MNAIWNGVRAIPAHVRHLELRAGPVASPDVGPDKIAAPSARSLTLVLDDPDAQVDGALGAWLDRLPSLRAATIVVRRAPDARISAIAKDLALRIPASPHVAFAIDFAIPPDADGIASLAAIQREKATDGMPAIVAASRELRAQGIPVRWLIPITRALVYRLEPLFSLARDEGIDPLLVPVTFVGGMWQTDEPAFTRDDRLFLADFIAFRILEEELHLLPADHRSWYEALLASFADDSPPLLADEAESLRIPAAPPVGASGANLRNQASDIASVLLEGNLALAQRMRGGMRQVAVPERLPVVLLVGAYGGDHIGDTAILGGVLLRLHRRYGTTRAILMSQRASHTRHLVPMLDTPVEVEVDAYELAAVRGRMREVDAVVFAGGPLIDLPKQLVKHFYAASLALRQGKPFLMEGVGPGPFPRWPSKWTARRLVKMAARVSVRTTTDVNDPLLRGVAVEPGHDPAFDYLATRPAQLTRLRPRDEAWIDRLLQGMQGRPLIGLNLRPIRHLFTLGAPAGQRAQYTRTIESQCEQNLAQGMLQFDRASKSKPCFIFFPMNAIQFGSSDLRSAYRLQRVLDPEVDFRVWQDDAALDGVVALLRRLDIAITMRFHATIFAMSQDCRVLGIDYRIGKQDKVGVLMAENGQGANCRRIDELQGDWVAARLAALAAGS